MTYHFIHVPRTGGTSIRQAIRGLDWIKYHGPGFDPRRLPPHAKTIMVRRPEAGRFASAVRWAIQRYSHEPQVAALIEAGITTPRQFRDGIREKDPLVLAEVLNHSHYVGRRFPVFKITYMPTSYWLESADYEIPFEDIRTEFPKLVYKLTRQYTRVRQTNRTDRDYVV